MSPVDKWWILCAFSLSFLSVSCRRHREDEKREEPLIFNELCAMKDDPGPCKAIKDRFFFNLDSGQCELFEYGGCGGNANNFATVEACEEMCVVTADKNPCHLPEAPGPCRGLMTRYFYDNAAQTCAEFYFGGCLGNANNFKSLTECQARCQSADKPTKVPDVGMVQPQVQSNHTRHPQRYDGETAEFCMSPVERGPCDGSLKRFAFNPKTKRCQMFLYGGCGGNKNNFTHRRYCIRKCIRRNSGMNMIRIRKKNMDNLSFNSA